MTIASGLHPALPGMEAARLEDAFRYTFEFRLNKYLSPQIADKIKQA